MHVLGSKVCFALEYGANSVEDIIILTENKHKGCFLDVFFCHWGNTFFGVGLWLVLSFGLPFHNVQTYPGNKFGNCANLLKIKRPAETVLQWQSIVEDPQKIIRHRPQQLELCTTMSWKVLPKVLEVETPLNTSHDGWIGPKRLGNETDFLLECW